MPNETIRPTTNSMGTAMFDEMVCRPGKFNELLALAIRLSDIKAEDVPSASSVSAKTVAPKRSK